MRIVLASPKGPLYRKSGIFKQSLRYMPLTLPTLASLIPPELDARLECLDEGYADIDPERIEADLVGMTVITGSAPRAYALAAVLRQRGITVVLGGPHVTLVPDDAAPHADAIVIGYAEDTWPQLLRDFAAGQLQPRYLQAANLSLAGRPLPDRTVLPRRHYLTDNVFEATRSCVHACEFCVAPAAWGRRPLHKPVAEVVADIRAHGARKAIFVDLNLIAERAYAAELFAALRPLGIQWYGLATTLVVQDVELLDLIAASGCRGLLLGFESIVAENLSDVRKGFNKPDDYARVVELLHQRRIAVQGCFVFGMDADTPEICAETAELAVAIGIDLPRFAISTPFPGTPLHQRLEAAGRILTRDWQRYDGQHVVFQPARMSPRELELATEAAWRHAYSWRSIARRLRHAAAPWPVAIGTNLGYRFYAHNLHRFYTCDWALAADPLRSLAPRPLPRSSPVASAPALSSPLAASAIPVPGGRLLSSLSPRGGRQSPGGEGGLRPEAS
jgi:radical SAM superfamily enzyme YgiQ (UPF0313 family)